MYRLAYCGLNAFGICVLRVWWWNIFQQRWIFSVFRFHTEQECFLVTNTSWPSMTFLSFCLSVSLSFFFLFFSLLKFWISLFFLRSVPTSLLRQHSSFLPQHYFTGGKKLGIIKISSFWYSYTRIVCQSHAGKTYFICYFRNVKGTGPS